MSILSLIKEMQHLTSEGEPNDDVSLWQMCNELLEALGQADNLTPLKVIRDLQIDLSERHDKIRDLSKEVYDTDAANTSLEKQVMNLEGQAKEDSKEIDQLNDYITTIKAELGESVREVDELVVTNGHLNSEKRPVGEEGG